MKPCFHPVLLRAYKQGEVRDDSMTGLIEAHLAQCEACQELLETQPESQLMNGLLSEGDTTSLYGLGDTLPEDVRDLPAVVLQHAGWRWLGRLGRGGAGDVYLARNTFTNQLHAVKVIPLRDQYDPGVRDRIRRESVVAELPPHENLLQVGEPKELGAHALFTMPHIPGEDLERLAVRSGGKLPIAEACGLMLQVLAGLDHASRFGLTHRDIKPANLMLDQDGVVKILDFGLAKLRAGDAGDSLTRSMIHGIGTPLYMAAEQAASLRSADHRSDLYSVGCTLYRLLAGRPPFDESTGCTGYDAILIAHRTQRPTDLTKLRPEVPAKLNEAVQRLLAKRPDDRFPDARAAARALAPFATDEGRRAAHGWWLSGPAAAPEKRRNSLGRKVAVAVGVLSLLATAAWGVKVSVQTKAGVVTLVVDQPNAQVTIDDKPAKFTKIKLTEDGKQLLEIVAEKGERRLLVKKGGFEAWSREIRVETGRGNHVEVSLEPDPPPVAPKPEPAKIAPPKVTAPRVPPPPFVTGSWKIENGELISEGTPKKEFVLLFGDPEWKDYDFSCEIMEEKQLEAGVKAMENSLYCLSDAANENRWKIDPGAFNSSKNLDVLPVVFGEDRWKNPARRFVGNRLDLRAGEWFKVKLQVRGGQLTVFVNDDKITATRHAALQQGRVGVGTFNVGRARWRKFEVRTPDGTLLWEGPPQLPESAIAPPQATVVAEPPVAAKPLTAEWTPLFNGRDLSGWEQSTGDGEWRVRDGELICDRSRRWLVTERRDFGDFELRAEVFLSPNANAGLYARTQPREWSRNGEGRLTATALDVGHYELELWLPTDSKWYTIGTVHRVPVNGNRRFLSSVLKQPTEANRWFEYHARLKDGEITISVDGTLVNRCRDDRPLPAGAIALQSFYPKADSVIKFRQLEVRAAE